MRLHQYVPEICTVNMYGLQHLVQGCDVSQQICAYFMK